MTYQITSDAHLTNEPTTSSFERPSSSDLDDDFDTAFDDLPTSQSFYDNLAQIEIAHQQRPSSQTGPLPASLDSSAAPQHQHRPSFDPSRRSLSPPVALSEGSRRRVEIELEHEYGGMDGIEENASVVDGTGSSLDSSLGEDELEEIRRSLMPVDGEEGGDEDVEDMPAHPSLFALYRRRGYFSITDLVAPSWCEVQFDYGLRGQRYLPPKERPTIIVTSNGKEIRPNLDKAVENDKVMRKGTKIHKKLEREIHPVEIQVQVQTKEETWALRLYNMLASLQALMTLGTCREMPVMGWIQGHFCVGIIDEIQRRPIPTPSPIVPSSSTSASIKATDALTSQSNKITSYFRPPAPASAASLLPSVDSAVIDLTGGSDEDEAMPSTRAKQEDAEGRRKKPTHALYVSDSKTRKTNTLPTAEASHAGKLQLQCYKLLLDALLRPASSPSSSSSSITGSSPLATLDPDALQPFTFLRLYAYLGLDSSAPFSPAFLAQTHVLIEGNQLGERAVARNLGELEFVWELAMDGLGVDRSKGCEEEMELVYRFQGAGKAKEKGARTRKGIGQGKGRGTDREAELIEQEEERLLRMALKASMETSTGGSEGELGEAVDGDGDAGDPVGENADLAMAVALSLLEDSTTPDRDEQAETDRTGPKALEGRMLLGGSIQADAYSSDGRSSTFEIDDGQDLVADTALEPGRSDTLNALSPVTAPASNSLSLIANRRIEKPRLPHPSSSAWGSASPSLLRPLRQPPFDSAPRRPTSSDPSNANYQPLESPARSACNLPDTPFTYSYLLSLPMSNLVSICVSESIPFLGTKHALAKRILKALPSTPSLSLPKDSPRWKDDGEGSSLSDGRSSKRARTNSASSAEKSAENEKRDPTDEDSSGSDSEPKDLLSSSPSPPSSPLTHSASVITSTNIIGRVPVRYSHSRLMDHITEVLEFWTGVRAPRGVSIENANRCDWCEYRDDCEWREKEGRRLWEAVRTKKQRGTSKEDSLLHEL